MAKQRVALITGGSKRVGRAIIQRLSESGFAIAFTYLSSPIEAGELARSTGGLAIQADLTNPPGACDKIYREFTGRFESLDLLVNNASIYQASSLSETDVPLARKLMAIHFESPMLLAQHFEPHLRQTRGRIVNMVDLLAEKPLSGYIAYCASKAALWNLTLSLARSLAPEVTVNGIAPGVVEWPANYPQADRDNYLKRVPLDRAGTPVDVAELVHFLATTGSYITGQIIRLDGGRSMT